MTKNTNANTPHSKKLRGQTANEWKKEKIEKGEAKRLAAMIGEPHVVDYINIQLIQIGKQQNLKKIDALKYVIEQYREKNPV